MKQDNSEPNEEDVIVWVGHNYLDVKIRLMSPLYLDDIKNELNVLKNNNKELTDQRFDFMVKIARLEKALKSIVDNEFRYGTALIDGEEKTPMRIAREALESK
jgi:hypothetical protein